MKYEVSVFAAFPISFSFRLLSIGLENFNRDQSLIFTDSLADWRRKRVPYKKVHLAAGVHFTFSAFEATPHRLPKPPSNSLGVGSA